MRVTIVGGGFAGAACAVHLRRRAEVDVVVVEPRAQLGGGRAHGTLHPDHRLNAPDVIHFLYPDDDQHLRRWLADTGRLAADPDAWAADGRLYPRRADFAAYVAAEVATHAVTHVRAAATGLERRDGRLRVLVDGADPIDTDRCVIAVGQEPAAPELPGLGDRLVADPLAPGALAAVDGDVLVVGTGLTAADAVVALLRAGHRGHVTCVSRRGLRPFGQRPLGTGPTLWERLSRPPGFPARHGLPASVRELTRIVRADAGERVARGEPWHDAIDEVRDAAGELWRALPVAEQRRFLRHARAWYDVHRFRVPPQTAALLAEAEARGQLTFQAARVLDARRAGDGVEVVLRARGGDERTWTGGHVLHCAGFSPSIRQSRSPFVRACLDGGLARPSPLGRSLDVDDLGRVISAAGAPSPDLFALGPAALDHFGETPAAIFIVRQVLRALGEMSR